MQRSIAIRDGRIVIAYMALGIVGDGGVGLFSTKTDFASFSDEQIAPTFQHEHLVGFVQVGGDTKLAAAFNRQDRVRYRRRNQRAAIGRARSRSATFSAVHAHGAST